jgi:hypothetical protein
VCPSDPSATKLSKPSHAPRQHFIFQACATAAHGAACHALADGSTAARARARWRSPTAWGCCTMSRRRCGSANSQVRRVAAASAPQRLLRRHTRTPRCGTEAAVPRAAVHRAHVSTSPSDHAVDLFYITGAHEAKRYEWPPRRAEPSCAHARITQTTATSCPARTASRMCKSALRVWAHRLVRAPRASAAHALTCRVLRCLRQSCSHVRATLGDPTSKFSLYPAPVTNCRCGATIPCDGTICGGRHFSNAEAEGALHRVCTARGVCVPPLRRPLMRLRHAAAGTDAAPATGAALNNAAAAAAAAIEAMEDVEDTCAPPLVPPALRLFVRARRVLKSTRPCPPGRTRARVATPRRLSLWTTTRARRTPCCR